jgi:hypothetical protein
MGIIDPLMEEHHGFIALKPEPLNNSEPHRRPTS